MQKDQEMRKKIVPYLLGELSPEEQNEFEDQYFNDDSLFEEISIVEDELIEAQVYGELSGSRLKRFKDQFAEPVRQQKLDFTKALLQYAQAQPQLVPAASIQTPPVRPSRLRLFFQQLVLAPRWLVLACALSIVVGSISLIYLIRARREVNQLRNDRADLEQRARQLEEKSAAQDTRIEQLASELDRTREGLKHGPQPAGSPEPSGPGQMAGRSGNVATGVIIARLVRGGKPGTQALRVSPAATVLRLQVIIEKGNHESYQLIIADDGNEVFRQNQLKSQQTSNQNFISVEVPLRQISPGRRYLLTVSGVDSTGKAEEAGQTYFSFVRR